MKKYLIPLIVSFLMLLTPVAQAITFDCEYIKPDAWSLQWRENYTQNGKQIEQRVNIVNISPEQAVEIIKSKAPAYNVRRLELLSINGIPWQVYKDEKYGEAIKEALSSYPLQSMPDNKSVVTLYEDIPIVIWRTNNQTPIIEKLAQAPTRISGRIMVPLIGLGFRVDKKGNSIIATSYRNDKIVKLTLGSTKAYVNSVPVKIDVAPIIMKGQVMIPVRFISESMGYKVDWDNSAQRADITL